MAEVEHDAPVGDGERAARVLLDQQHGEVAGVAEPADQRHDLGGAISQYHKAIRLRADSAAFHSNLGTALFARKDYDAAMAEYAHALQLDPDIFERRSRGGIAARMIDSQEIGRYNYVLAKMYASVGNPDRCLLYLRKALEEGYSGIKDVYKEREFERIRKDPRFVALMNSKMPQISPQ